jgi:hypothetical protein
LKPPGVVIVENNKNNDQSNPNKVEQDLTAIDHVTHIKNEFSQNQPTQDGAELQNSKKIQLPPLKRLPSTLVAQEQDLSQLPNTPHDSLQ